MKDTTSQYKGYTGLFTYEPEGGYYSGEVIGTEDTIIFGGKTFEEAKLDFEDIIDQYLGMCAQTNREPIFL